ncbi:GumC family protein [Pseudooctadecabacter jejudonensis]|uniref:Chain length determinant protein n=1 Tax=Pseudooctadecabacter jejudonensis TaxID=1391910 RepID=A0A1Y5RYS0_9RHOB|nr:hypothetical protein [Pseudooctadecabacter jejudonensis]SLN27242.1 hypothetical protein PSJ8397_01127 [Pseudooctadecabacter jejudonensis]
MTVRLALPFRPRLPHLSIRGFGRRILMGGRVGDLRRMPRYVAVALLGTTLIWAPLLGYLKSAPLSFRSTTSLILPGSGASASMNLNGIGQASSYANSAFASNAVSPTETYKRLLGADRIVDATARSLGLTREALGAPRVRLVDQTSLIHIEMEGPTPEDAQAKGVALVAVFLAELDALRADEVRARETSGSQAITEYRASVGMTRARIETLQNQTGLMSVDQYNTLVDRQLSLDALIFERRAGVNERRARLAALETQLGLGVQAAAATLKLFADGGYLALLDDIALSQVALSEANARFGSRHPQVEAARNARDEAAAAAAQLAQTVTGLNADTLAGLDLAPQGARAELLAELVRLHVELEAATEELSTLIAQQADGQAQIDSLAPVAAEMQDLERDFSVSEAVFASAIARNESSKSDVYASYPLVQVLEDPSLPNAPSSPNRKLAVLAGIAATLMLIFGLSLGWIRNALISWLLVKSGGSK